MNIGTKHQLLERILGPKQDKDMLNRQNPTHTNAWKKLESHFKEEMKKVLLILLGLIIMVVGVWVGSYLMNIYTDYSFASYVTGALIVAFGCVVSGRAAGIHL